MTIKHYMLKPLPSSAHGFSLIELMVALTIGLLLVMGVTYVMVSTSQTRAELDRASRQIENGRYAMQVLSNDIRQAGFFGRLTVLPTAPATPTDPCTVSKANLGNSVALPIVGYDNSVTAPSCVSNHLAGTDIIVVRRASSFYDPAAALSGTTYYIQSDASTNIVDTGANATLFTLTKKAVPSPAPSPLNASLYSPTKVEIRKYILHIYWISSVDSSGNSIPTLMMKELDSTGGLSAAYPIAEGIENLQFDYGLDPAIGSAAAADGSPDGYDACASTTCDALWKNVTALRISLLARNTETSIRYQDTKIYTLGLNTNGSAKTLDSNLFTNADRAYKRHVYNGVVRLNNIAGRREL